MDVICACAARPARAYSWRPAAVVVLLPLPISADRLLGCTKHQRQQTRWTFPFCLSFRQHELHEGGTKESWSCPMSKLSQKPVEQQKAGETYSLMSWGPSTHKSHSADTHQMWSRYEMVLKALGHWYPVETRNSYWCSIYKGSIYKGPWLFQPCGCGFPQLWVWAWQTCHVLIRNRKYHQHGLPDQLHGVSANPSEEAPGAQGCPAACPLPGSLGKGVWLHHHSPVNARCIISP